MDPASRNPTYTKLAAVDTSGSRMLQPDITILATKDDSGSWMFLGNRRYTKLAAMDASRSRVLLGTRNAQNLPRSIKCRVLLPPPPPP